MPTRLLLLAGLLASAAHAQAPLTADAAHTAFAELAALADADGGDLWGVRLDGPVLLVEPASRRVVASESGDGLQPENGVFVGALPESLPIANTALTWGDRHWTMLMWPLPEAADARRQLGAHELWHRVQADLGFPSTSAPTLHLGTRDGRFWLRLEWRALATALRSDGSARKAALRDALLFRAMRLDAFPGAEAEERALVMHEGLAEYTGIRLSGRDADAQREHAADALARAEANATYVRSFAYASGPAYGLLLDSLAPDWRTRAVGADLPVLAAEALGVQPPAALEDAARWAASAYDGARLAAEEDALADGREQHLADLRRRFVDGPVLRLNFRQMSVSFDPNGIEALDDLGTVYTSMRLTDAWGTLEVTGGGLIAADWSHALVPAPTSEQDETWTGEGYTLTLADGWRLAAGDRTGDLRATEETP